MPEVIYVNTQPRRMGTLYRKWAPVEEGDAAPDAVGAADEPSDESGDQSEPVQPVVTVAWQPEHGHWTPGGPGAFPADPRVLASAARRRQRPSPHQ